jgi:hypothetical protein
VSKPQALDQSDDETIYVGNGSDESEVCDPSRPFQGGILGLSDSLAGTQVAKGFRNPIAIRCQRGHNRCYAVELALDYSADDGGREKLVRFERVTTGAFRVASARTSPTQRSRPLPIAAASPPKMTRS